MSMPRTPLQSVLKVMTAIDPNVAVNVEEEEVAEYLRLLVDQIEDNHPANHPDAAGHCFDKILERIQQIDDDTELLRQVCAQEASRLYQVYYRRADYLILESDYHLPFGTIVTSAP